METPEYGLILTDEQRALRTTAHDFAAQVLRPTGLLLDRMPPDAVRVPARNLVMGTDAYAPYMHEHLSLFNAGVGILATGLARAAYEATLGYCRERVQGGRPIIQHQSVRARLCRMYALVRACLAMARDAWVYNLTQLLAGGHALLQLSIGSKVFCTQAAHEVTTLAVQLHGGNGMRREYEVEMFMRDATAMTIADGENAFLAQIAAALL